MRFGVERSGNSVLSDEKPEELFRELVRGAMRERGIASSEMAEYYIVDLLSRAVCDGLDPNRLPIPTDCAPPQTLAEGYLIAANLSPRQREAILKWVGDRALFVAGYFSESLEKKPFRPDYYEDLGRMAYRSAAGSSHGRGFGELFGELASRFSDFVSVITHVKRGGPARDLWSRVTIPGQPMLIS